MKIDPIKRALELRKTIINDEKLLVTNFEDTLQGKDTSKVIDIMPNVFTGDKVFRTKFNIKELDPIASEVYHTEFFDVRKHTNAEIENFVKSKEFDFPLWFKHTDDEFSMKKICNYVAPFIYQVGGCNFNDGSETGGCWYCFVDNQSNDGVVCNGKTYIQSNESILSMVHARKQIKETYKKRGMDVKLKVMRVSGGEPTIALDWILEMWRSIQKNKLDFVGQIDSNLSTGQIVDYFEKKEIFEKDTLEQLAKYPVKVLAAVKGTDMKNMQSNVQAKTTMKDQLYSLEKFINAGFDVYPQMYNPNPKTIEKYLSQMDKKIDGFSIKTHIGPLKIYSPTKQRLTLYAKQLGIEPEQYIQQKKTEWDNNYSEGCKILDSYLQKNHGIPYKEIPRPDIKLRVN